MQQTEQWWERRSTVVLLTLLSMVPLIWPAIPPLVDLPGHMGRYRVQLDYNTSAVLRQFYRFEWSLIGNLGVDLLIVPMAKLFGLETGVKLIVMAIPALTVGGLLWIAREVHGRIPPTALFALPLAYGHPFHFGFVNFTLSMALALLAFALWLRLARLDKLRLRAAVFLIIGPVLWVTHAYGWGTLGVLAFSAELIRQHDRGENWVRAAFWSGVQCLALAPPLILMLAWRSDHGSGDTGDWFNWQLKRMWLYTTLRDRWRVFDTASVILLAMTVFFAIRDKRLELSRNLAVSGGVLALVFVLMPRFVFGSAYADMRLTPFILAIALIGIRFRPEASSNFARGIAYAGLAFFAVRTAATTTSFAIFSSTYDRALAALVHIPVGSRVVSFTRISCRAAWATNHMEHLAAMATVRRSAFANNQWEIAGAQLITVIKSDAPGFTTDPSQIVIEPGCRSRNWRSLDWSLQHLPHAAFDYIWLIDPPRFDPRSLKGARLVWREGTHALYQIQ